MGHFSFEHCLWLLAAAFFAFCCSQFFRFPLNSKVHTYFRWSVFTIALFLEVSWSLYGHFFLRLPWQHNLPLHISDMATINLLLGMATRKKVFANLAYFMATFGVSLALFFPKIFEVGAIRNISILRFWLAHILTFGSGFYLTFGIRQYPRFKEFLTTYGIVLAYGFCLIPINNALGTNYFYANFPPPQIPAWGQGLPQLVYSLGFAGFFFIPFFVLWLPFYFIRRRTP